MNRIQLNRPISDSEVKYLRKGRLIEGRMPNIYISKDVAQKTKQSVKYSKHKGLKDKVCEELLLSALKDHKKLSKKEIMELLWSALPSGLDDKQKYSKISNILTKLRKSGKISNETRGIHSDWFLI